ncbi:MAG TPA: YfcE family phosphodiesterase [Clostridiales bacterium]|nr:YfcE family phosphodiesterase [Clostridiales bacterium]
MKVLIVSDTHGRNYNLLRTVERVSPIDLLIHLGDYDGGEDYIMSVTPCRTEMVSGNNDFFNGLPKEKVIQIGKYTVLLTHGHRYGVYYTTQDIKREAAKYKANIVMFGHTHVPMIDLSEEVWAINPGSLGLPRQNNHIPTFIIMDIDSEGNAHFTLNYYQEAEG